MSFFPKSDYSEGSTVASFESSLRISVLGKSHGVVLFLFEKARAALLRALIDAALETEAVRKVIEYRQKLVTQLETAAVLF